MSSNILSADDFTFAPFTPRVGGDSGALQLAASKSDAQIQYVVKSGYPEIACNEFMYHHVAAALGLYTQETRLFKGVKGSKYAVGIRYVPNARKFIYEKADEENRHIYYKFRMLFVILNEEDSEEYFCDEQNRIFKLDNAASFNLDAFAVGSAIKFETEERPDWVWNMFIHTLNYVEYSKYSIILRALNKYFGRPAVETGYDFIRQFSKFPISSIGTACETLKEIYPPAVTEYYPTFIERRINACKRFISENDISVFIGKQPL